MTAKLNTNRKKRTPRKDPLSWSCIHTFVEYNTAFDLHRLETEGTSKKDRNETWFKAWLANFTELLQRHQYYIDPTLMGPTPVPPINIFAIMWSDKHHSWVCSGHASKYECLVARDDSGKVAAQSEGGKSPPQKKVQTQKYPSQGRAYFAAGMRGILEEPVYTRSRPRPDCASFGLPKTSVWRPAGILRGKHGRSTT